MSRIDDLIAELCPDGVSFFSLGDLCVVKTGEAVNHKMIQQNPGSFPVINRLFTKESGSGVGTRLLQTVI